jgi:hypothetical protein
VKNLPFTGKSVPVNYRYTNTTSDGDFGKYFHLPVSVNFGKWILFTGKLPVNRLPFTGKSVVKNLPFTGKSVPVNYRYTNTTQTHKAVTHPSTDCPDVA